MVRAIPDDALALMAEKFSLLADASRLAILRELMEDERSVGEIVSASGLGQANVSKHLKLLADSGMVARRKEGVQVYYRVVDPLVAELCRLVCARIAADLEAVVAQNRRLIGRLRKAARPN